MGTSSPRESSARLGRYLLFESLGRGGMGEVFRARSFGAAGVVKDLCIKRIRAERLSEPAVARFVEEARLWMQLHHANVVSVFDFGRTGDEYYLAMEWVDGADLKTILRDAARTETPLAPEVAAYVASQVSRALGYGHGLGEDPIIHRDVKPGNVLISSAGDVKLTDFGVAVFAGAASQVGGTPAYMAPEQHEEKPVDARTDIYAIGVLLVEMLTGKPPKSADEVDARCLPEPLRPLIQSMLSKNPENRPTSAREVAAQLENFVSGIRLAGAMPPQDDLAQRASQLSVRSSEEASAELGAEMSFVRDGETTDFRTQMTRSAAPTALLKQAPAADHTPRGDTRGTLPASRARSYWMIGMAALALNLGVALTGWWALSASVTDEPARASEVSSVEPTGRPSSGPDENRHALSSAVEQGSPRSRSEGSTTADLLPAPTPSVIAAPDTTAVAPAPRAWSRRSEQETTPPPSPSEEVGPDESEVGTSEAEMATLSINAVPWAEVQIDGVPKGTTPLFNLRLPARSYQIRLTNGPLESERETTVNLRPGDTRSVVVEMQ